MELKTMIETPARTGAMVRIRLMAYQRMTPPSSARSRGYSWKYTVLKNSLLVGFATYPFTFFWNGSGG
jgi:hypothetical protein